MEKARFPTNYVLKVLGILVPIILISLEIFLNVVAVGTVINGIVLLIVLTSPLWILLLMFWWPVLIVLGVLFRFTSINSYLKSLMLHSLNHMLFKYKGQSRKTIWCCVESLWALNLPNYITAQNCGYALVSATGKSIQQSDLIKPLTDQERDNIF
jgi:hypothetical protein